MLCKQTRNQQQRKASREARREIYIRAAALPTAMQFIAIAIGRQGGEEGGRRQDEIIMRFD